MTWTWLDLVDGAFRTWPKARERPTARALRVDGRLAAGGSPATWVSWCRFEDEATSLAFDDGAVSQALRRRLAAPAWPVAVSTALVDWSRIAGTITVGLDEAAVRDDPFAAVFPRTIVRVPAGTFGAVPAPTGPGITRYGSGNPWPWSEYRGQVA
jgi:hypothetical protein